MIFTGLGGVHMLRCTPNDSRFNAGRASYPPYKVEIDTRSVKGLQGEHWGGGGGGGGGNKHRHIKT